MAGTTTNCARFREQMLDAASAALSGGVRAAFDAHLHHCAACREEFGRVQTLVQKIDQTLSVSLAVEPSARLVANVRKNILQDIPQSINAQPHGAAAWRPWSAWVTAAGVCAALAILLLVARTSRKFDWPIHEAAIVQTNAPPTVKAAVHPRLNAGTEVAVSQPRKPVLDVARHASLRASHGIAGEPEVIVQPGQMQAVFQLIAETQRGQISGANLLNNEKKAAEPFEITPIAIAPLKVSAMEDEPEPSTSNGGLDSSKSSLSDRSN